ncbi:hypothetical protein [Actinomadura yumaensis]|uniref:RapZ C-terminal domain-containing protein n=1 Tax=Actinomadura yumaensis TaxID=111807 RepID=A0ABW2CNS8_9ACTN
MGIDGASSTPEVVHVISFGTLHLAAEEREAPAADRTEDVSERLSDPAGYRQVLAWLEDGPVDGRDRRVRELVAAAPGAAELLDEVTTWALARRAPVVGFSCHQGHDRSVALAELLAERLRAAGRRVVVEHLHVHLPRIRP